MTPEERARIDALIQDPHIYYDEDDIKKFVEFIQESPMIQFNNNPKLSQLGFPICGKKPGPGERVWAGDIEYTVADDGESLIEVYKSEFKVSIGERIAAFFFCPACFLPRFVPGHKFRGCNGEYGW